MPPAIKILPSGSTVAVCSARAVIMLPVSLHFPKGWTEDALTVALGVVATEELAVAAVALAALPLEGPTVVLRPKEEA